MRGAYYALISALSGAQTMALCCYDEAYTIPSEYAQRISLRTMQLLVEEIGLADTVDPLAGSYYVETLTNEMRDVIEAIMGDVDARGGIVPLIAETGGINAMIVDSSALPEQVVADVVASAFGSAGQRCSALRLLFV